MTSIKMRSYDRTFPTTTAPRLNYRQSTILTTPVDKSYSSSNLSSPSSVQEPYCAAAAPSQLLLPPPAARHESAVTNKSSPTYHDDDTTSSSNCFDLDRPVSSLLLRKATSQSSMNLTTLVDDCHEQDIIPRPSQSAPYSTSSPSPQEENNKMEEEDMVNTLF
ncbi:hypothetical protein BC941DRAFT_191834 [Chlamydoabsidia padenii]|nr:hypothetical protein BC941DRAFT_191834 [Chlamydoabsidia padenii]